VTEILYVLQMIVVWIIAREPFDTRLEYVGTSPVTRLGA
jgi:hypothetical protein